MGAGVPPSDRQSWLNEYTSTRDWESFVLWTVAPGACIQSRAVTAVAGADSWISKLKCLFSPLPIVLSSSVCLILDRITACSLTHSLTHTPTHPPTHPPISLDGQMTKKEKEERKQTHVRLGRPIPSMCLRDDPECTPNETRTACPVP